MTPSARVQAAIEIIDLVIAAAKSGGASADRIVSGWFKTRRFAGSKDRRAVRDLVFQAIRACGDVPVSGRSALLRLAQVDPTIESLFDGSPHGPAPIVEGEPVASSGIAPPWLEERLLPSGVDGDSAKALLGRAPLDIRVNSLKADRDTIVLPEPAEPTVAPQGLRLPTGTPAERWDAWAEGLIEVQDTGSQLACLAVGAAPGETVIDLCAGGGGKTLALAAAMRNRGVLIVSDTDRARLSRLEPRARRAGAEIAHTVLLNPGREAEALAEWHEGADAVLVDAPCSGTGTWRRNPEARWRLTEDRLGAYCALQARLLDVAAGLVRPGGRIVYVTCSLLDEEGADQIAAFLARHDGWRAASPGQILPVEAGEARGGGIRLRPQRDGTDGFFVARLMRL